jgi:hypothetical protein
MSATGPPAPPTQQTEVPTPLGGYFTQSTSLKEGDWGYGAASFMGGPTTPGSSFGPQGPVSTDASSPGTGGPPFSPPGSPPPGTEYCRLEMSFKGSLLTKGKNGGANMEGGGEDAAGNPELGFGCTNGKARSCVMLKGIIELKCTCAGNSRSSDDTSDESGRNKKGKMKDRQQKKMSHKGRGNCDMVGGENNFETGTPNHVFEADLNDGGETTPSDPSNDSPTAAGMSNSNSNTSNCKKKRGPKIEWSYSKQLSQKCKDWEEGGVVEGNVTEEQQTDCGADGGGYQDIASENVNPPKAPCGYKKCRLCLNIAICIPIGCGKKKGPNGTKPAHEYAGALRLGTQTYGDESGPTGGGSDLDGFDDQPADGTNPNKKCKRMKNLASQCNPCSNAKNGTVVDQGDPGISDDNTEHEVNDGNSKEGTRDLLKEIARDMLNDMFGDDLKGSKSCEDALKKLLDTLKEAGNEPNEGNMPGSNPLGGQGPQANGGNRWWGGQGDARNAKKSDAASQPFGPSHAPCKSVNARPVPKPGEDDC